jgi:hypothetical protein
MPSQFHHLDMTPVVQNIQSLTNCQNQQTRGPSGNSHIPPAERCVSVPAGERDSSPGGSSVASTIQSQNSIPSSSLNNSCTADITQCMTSTPSAMQLRLIYTPTATHGKSCRGTPAPGGTPRRCVISSPAFGHCSHPHSFCRLENLPTPIPNPEARAIIKCPLQMRATEKNQRQRQWQLQPQAVSTLQSLVSHNHRTNQFVHLNITSLVFATGRLLERYMWNRQPFKSESDLETIRYATQRVLKALAEAPHRQITVSYWNTAMQQNIIWTIAFEARTKEILTEVC